MAEIDLSWAHPSFAERLRKIFLNIRQDDEGRLNVNDVKLRFQRHALPLIDEIEIIRGVQYAFLSENWQTIIKDWAMCAGVWPYCPKEDPVWGHLRPKKQVKMRKKLCHR
jgi:hypothetical protein